MEFRKSYTLSLEDYLSYNLFSHRKQLIRMPLLFLVLMVVVCLVIGLVGHSLDYYSLIVALALIIVFAALITVSNVMTMNRHAKRRYQDSQALQSEFELVIDKNGVRESAAAGTSKAEWSQIIYAVESKKAIYIHVSPLKAFVIPKALLNPKEDVIIRKLLMTRLAPKRCRIKR